MKSAIANPKEALKELQDWLKGNANYSQGIELYVKYGGDRGLVARTLKPKGACAANKRTLMFHIKNIIKGLEPLVTPTDSEQPKTDNNQQGGNENSNDGPKKVKLPEKGMAKLYPNVKLSECPDPIKLMFAEALGTWNKLCEAHDKDLEAAETDEERLAIMEDLFIAKEDNKLAHAELKHFNDTGKILGKHPKLELDAYEDQMIELKKSDAAKLQKERDKCYNNYTRQKKRLDDGEYKNKAKQEALVAKWSSKLAICDKLLAPTK